ncbi:MAG TPA: PASTA domain-containing protein [Kribbella sp.]|nr:PASTA domain-containing protein [Kribbella sp.]
MVSKGPTVRDVPNVVRKPLGEAQKVLAEAGFVVEVEQAPFHLGLNLVAGQNPKAGQKAKAGSTVVVTVL